MRALLLIAALGIGLAAHGATPQLAAGADHSLALSSEGKVFAWGDDASGQLGSARKLFQSTPVAVKLADPSNVVSVAAGPYHTLARMRDGSVLTWGNNTSGELGDNTLTGRGVPLKVLGLPFITAISAGEQHSVAVDSTGEAWTWGSNTDGRLGTGSNEAENSKVPVKVAGLQDVKDARAGKGHTIALTRQGVVMAWGINHSGQLGDSTGRTRLTPVPVDFPLPMPTIVAIDAAGDQNFALDSQGRLWTWGDNQFYQLGESIYAFRTYPLYLEQLEQRGKVKTFAVGPSGGAAVLEDGSLWVWGFYRRYSEPTAVTGLPNRVSGVRLGDGLLLITLVDGRILSTGDNQLGQLGDGTNVSPAELMFVAPQGLSAGVNLFATGYYHALALDIAGHMWAWGDNTRGQLGDGVATNTTVPQVVAGLDSVTQIAAGHRHALALRGDGTVWAWGDNDEGAVGDGSDVRLRTGATQVKGLTGVQRISAGGSSSAAIDANGKLWVWGSNFRGQLALAADLFRTSTAAPAQGVPALREVAVGNEHMLGLDASKTVWVWGSNGYGQLGDGYQQTSEPRKLTSLPPITAISAGGDHSMALDQDGRVWAWGDNGYSQVGPSNDSQVKVPILVTGLPRIKAIAAGFLTSMALDESGSIWTWGSGQEGQLGDETQEIRAVPVRADGQDFIRMTAGVLHSLAIRRDGLVWGFGLNYSGQLGDGSFANQSSYTGVVDAGLSRFFDVLPEVPNDPVPVGKLPPFFAKTLKIGNDRLLSLSTQFILPTQTPVRSRLERAQTGQVTYNLYVAALVPGAAIGQPNLVSTIWLRSRLAGWGQYVGGPLAAYLSNVAASDGQALVIDILESTDLSTLVGTRFYVGYGTSADEMLASGRIRLVYEVQGVR